MLNKVVLMGRLTRDPELKYTKANDAVLTFNIAVERNYTDSSGDRPTDFITCVAWRKTAEFIANWFSKGSMIAVVGEIQTRKWTDKDGNNRVSVEVNVSEVQFTGEKKRDSSTGGNQSGGNYGNAHYGNFNDCGNDDFIEYDDGEGVPF